MKKLLLFTASLLFASNVWAVEMPKEAQTLGCTGCHAIDKQLVGPAWKDVADKYKQDKDAETKLITKVSNGGGGVWGKMPMPGMDPKGAKQAEVKSIVQFILSLAK